MGDLTKQEQRFTDEDLRFLVHKRLDPVLRFPKKYSKTEIINACADAVDYIDRA